MNGIMNATKKRLLRLLLFLMKRHGGFAKIITIINGILLLATEQGEQAAPIAVEIVLQHQIAYQLDFQKSPNNGIQLKMAPYGLQLSLLGVACQYGGSAL